MSLEAPVTIDPANGFAVVELADSAGAKLTSTLNGAKQSLDVHITGGSEGVIDQTAFVYGTDVFSPMGGVFQDTGPTLSSGQSGAVRLTAERGMHVSLHTAGGVALLGQQLMAASVPVVLSSDHSTIAVTAASLPLPSGAATETTLAAISSKMSPGSAALSNLAATTSSQTVLASNAARKGVVLANYTSKIAYVAFAASATTAAFSIQLQKNAVYESPSGGVYTGAISVIFSGADVASLFMITELT